jgi:4-hydroxythreonine-4-phosphate dehydrogenase
MRGNRANNGNDKPLIGITMGDPLGVGPEVIVKALSDPELRAAARYVIFGLHDALEFAADQAELSRFWWREPYDGRTRVASGVLVVDFDDLPQPGINGRRQPDELAGRASFRFVEEAIGHLKSGAIDALVTAPINKAAWRKARYNFRGHTDLLARRLEKRRVAMAFFADTLRIALASDHVPLFELRNRFTIGLVHQPIDLLDRALREWYGIERPHIGVLGLNPHAGEGGLLGDEEQRIIEPALALARNAKIHVTGPLSPDTAFVPQVLSRFDGLVAMYHDQALIPVKMHAFDRVVNVTLGLGVIRTSPGHGTAYEIAGRNQANPGSMIEAIRLAIQFAKSQRESAESAAVVAR